MKKVIADIPKKDETKLFQAHVDASLLERVQEKLHKDELRWRELSEALLGLYADGKIEIRRKA